MMHLMLAARFACVSVTPLGRDVEPLVNCRNATSSSAIFSALSGSRRLADPLDGDDLLERRALRLHGAEQALDLRRRDERARAALGDDVARVVEVGLELAERHGRVDRARA